MSVKAIPDGYHTATPYLVGEGASKLIDFLKQAFKVTERICFQAGSYKQSKGGYDNNNNFLFDVF